MKVTIIPIVIGAFCTVTKGLLKGLEDLDESRPSKLLHYWERAEYWEASWRLEETCCYSDTSERSSANADVKNWVNNNNNHNPRKWWENHNPRKWLRKSWKTRLWNWQQGGKTSWGKYPESCIPERCSITIINLLYWWCHLSMFFGNAQIDTNFINHKKRSVTKWTWTTSNC